MTGPRAHTTDAEFADRLVRRAEAWGRRNPHMREDGLTLGRRAVETRWDLARFQETFGSPTTSRRRRREMRRALAGEGRVVVRRSVVVSDEHPFFLDLASGDYYDRLTGYRTVFVRRECMP